VPVPTTPAAALEWAKDAVRCGQTLFSKHFGEQCKKRNLDNSERDGWRIHGVDLNGEEAAVGIETYQDSRTQRCVVFATAFRKDEK
jgi:hypothetical protein